ncbi:MAG: restriction endonuclease subunit S [Finegoldia magna]|nr:restriction endonuclease subunit S [Finegoldia magna]
MSRLDELIQELCPDGVEYKKIEEVANYEQPSKYIVKSTKYDDSYVTPVLTAGQTFILGYTNETDGIFQASKDNPVIIFDDFTGAFKWVDFPFKVKSSAMKIITIKENNMPLRYLFHIMGNLGFKSDEHKRLWISIYSQLKIPVPPLEVQREIVRVLDSFTLLTAELTAELTARKKQYEYYRDELLKPKTNIPMVKLGEIATIVRGASPRPIKNFITTDEDGVNWIKIGDVAQGSKYVMRANEKITEAGAKRSRRVKPGDFILSNSMSFGRPYILKIDGCVHDGWLIISEYDNNYLPDFLYHLLNSTSVQQEMAKRASFGGAVQNLNADIVKALVLPVPPLDVQKRYADVLDNFEKICNDISIGLPAEIEARQKQYEFYRDKLLSFEQL